MLDFLLGLQTVRVQSPPWKRYLEANAGNDHDLKAWSTSASLTRWPKG